MTDPDLKALRADPAPIVREWLKGFEGRESTHYDDCWKHHPACVASWLLDRIDILEAEKKVKQNAIDVLQSQDEHTYAGQLAALRSRLSEIEGLVLAGCMSPGTGPDRVVLMRIARVFGLDD